VPVQAGDFHYVGIFRRVLFSYPLNHDHGEIDDAAGDVRAVKSRNGIKGGSEQVIAPGVLAKCEAVINEMRPFVRLQAEKDHAAEDG